MLSRKIRAGRLGIGQAGHLTEGPSSCADYLTHSFKRRSHDEDQSAPPLFQEWTDPIAAESPPARPSSPTERQSHHDRARSGVQLAAGRRGASRLHLDALAANTILGQFRP